MKIHIAINGQQAGVFTIEQARAALANGALLPNDLAWHDALSEWTPLSSIPEIQLSTPPPVPAPASIPPVPNPAPIPDKPLATLENMPATQPSAVPTLNTLRLDNSQNPAHSQPVTHSEERPRPRISSSIEEERKIEEQTEAEEQKSPKANWLGVFSFILALFGILIVWVPLLGLIFFGSFLSSFFGARGQGQDLVNIISLVFKQNPEPFFGGLFSLLGMAMSFPDSDSRKVMDVAYVARMLSIIGLITVAVLGVMAANS